MCRLNYLIHNTYSSQGKKNPQNFQVEINFSLKIRFATKGTEKRLISDVQVGLFKFL